MQADCKTNGILMHLGFFFSLFVWFGEETKKIFTWINKSAYKMQNNAQYQMN